MNAQRKGKNMLRLRICGLCVVALWSTAGFVLAAVPPGDKPASPRSLPSDELPPFGMLDDTGKLIPVPVLTGGPPRTASAAPAVQPQLPPGPTMDVAIEGARAAIDACAAQGAQIAVAVVDSEGKPRALLMAEGSEGSVFVAMRKAAATLAYGVPSSEIGAKLAREPALLSKFTPVMFLSGGALPIREGNRLIGAIASSGAHGAGPIGAQDEICARAGLKKINERLASGHK
jgi:uncharacterized protein GlcG (DUF336 family)